MAIKSNEGQPGFQSKFHETHKGHLKTEQYPGHAGSYTHPANSGYAPAPQLQQPKPPTLSKHEKQVHTVIQVLTSTNIAQVYLCQNLLGTRYFIFVYELFLISDPQLYKKLKALINRIYNIIVTDRAIKAALDVIEGSDDLWVLQSHSDLPTRISIINDKAAYRITHNKVFDLVASYQAQRNFDQYVGFRTQSDIKPATPYLINELNNYSAYQHFRENLPERLKTLYKFLLLTNVEAKSLPILLTWAIHSLISSDHVLLEITGEPENGKTTLLAMLKKLIDFTNNIRLSTPKNHKELSLLTLDHHLLSFDNVENLTDDLQNDFVKLLSEKGLEINLSKRGSQLFTVRRPIIITSIESVITNQQLIEKSISIELKEINNKKPVLNHLNDTEWENSIKDLLFLSRYVFERLHYTPHNLESIIDRPDQTKLVYHQPKMKSFVDIGLIIDDIIPVVNHAFLDRLNNLAKDQVDNQLNNNEVAFVIFRLAELNPSKTWTHSVIEWIGFLADYASQEKINLTNMTAHKLGREFKKAKPILKNYGIILESLGKQSRLVKWKITTPESIKNNTYKPIASFS